MNDLVATVLSKVFDRAVLHLYLGWVLKPLKPVAI